MDNRQIDKLVAQYVMGQTSFNHPKTVYKEDWNLEGSDGWSGFVCSKCGASEESNLPCVINYTTDIVAAWQVVEMLNSKLDENSHETWKKFLYYMDFDPRLEILSSQEAARKICLAALKAVGVEIDV